MFTSSLAEYITLWKGVVSETIGAVTAPSNLPHSIEPGERCGPPGIGAHTAAEKVGLWPYQELRGAIVELLCVHNVGHVRGIAPEGGFVNIRQRHDHGVMMEAPTGNNFLENGTRADIACDILCTLRQARHEALAASIVEPRTERQKGRRGEQTRHRPAPHHRVVLHEFHIHQVPPSAQRHGHPISRNAGDVGCLGIHLAASPSSENGRPSVDTVRLPMAAVYPYGPIAAPIL